MSFEGGRSSCTNLLTDGDDAGYSRRILAAQTF